MCALKLGVRIWLGEIPADEFYAMLIIGEDTFTEQPPD